MKLFKSLKIKAKIIVVISIVFCLMILATAWSIFNLIKVSQELDNLANIVIPIENITAKVDTEIVKQQGLLKEFELAVEKKQIHRLQKKEKSTKKEDDQHIKEAKKKFEDISHQINIDLEHEIKFIVEHLDDKWITPEVKSELNFLYGALSEIMDEHDQFHDHAVLFMQHLKENPNLIDSEEESLLIKEEKNLIKHMHDVDLHIKAFTYNVAQRANEHEKQGIMITSLATFFTGVIGLILAFFLAKGMLRPLFELLTNVRKVEDGDYENHFTIQAKDEIGDLGRAFKHMVGELKQKEKIKRVFGQYIDPRIVSGLIDDSSQSVDSPKKQQVTVFFSDIKKFTKISDQLPIDKLVDLINNYFALMSAPIKHEQGIIDKYIGDAIMAFWTTPFVAEQQTPLCACRAAYKSLSVLKQFNETVQDILKIPDTTIGCRIGLATGEAIIGSIGPETSRSFTAMGRTINIGARLESINNLYGTSILVCEATRKASEGEFLFRELDLIELVPNSPPISVHECVGLHQDMTAERLDFYKHFDKGLKSYRKANWDDATKELQICAQLQPEDEATQVFLSRIERYKSQPTSREWKGIWKFKK